MTTWNEYIEENGTAPEWPYPIRYERENVISADVLIVGGGVAGCHAAISAAQHGATVALVESGNAKRSGAGGAGVDHWHGACTNPCSKVTPLDYTQACLESMHGYSNGIARYIICKEGWDTLLECEAMGMQIRDVHDEFKGAEFRDDETKLMFGYDYENRHVVRVWGFDIKPRIYQEAQRLGVQIYNRTLVTSLFDRTGAARGKGRRSNRRQFEDRRVLHLSIESDRHRHRWRKPVVFLCPRNDGWGLDGKHECLRRRTRNRLEGRRRICAHGADRSSTPRRLWVRPV